MTGSDNEGNFEYLGTYRPNLIDKQIGCTGLIYGLKSRIFPTAKSWIAIKYLFEHPDTPFIKIFHSGTCLKCGRKLTTPESILSGIGPKCKNS
jgi:Family of unknown function (DUF6011)